MADQSALEDTPASFTAQGRQNSFSLFYPDHSERTHSGDDTILYSLFTQEVPSFDPDHQGDQTSSLYVDPYGERNRTFSCIDADQATVPRDESGSRIIFRHHSGNGADRYSAKFPSGYYDPDLSLKLGVDQISLGLGLDTIDDASSLPFSGEGRVEIDKENMSGRDVTNAPRADLLANHGSAHSRTVSSRITDSYREQRNLLEGMNRRLARLVHAYRSDKEKVYDISSKCIQHAKFVLRRLNEYRPLPGTNNHWHNRGGFFVDLPLAFYRAHSMALSTNWEACQDQMETLEKFLTFAREKLAVGEIGRITEEYNISSWRRAGGSLGTKGRGTCKMLR